MRLISFICCAAFLSTAFAHPQPLDGVAAIVNDAIITKSELAQQMKMISQQIQQSGTALPDKMALEKQVLDHLILKEAQLQIAKRTGIHVSDAATDNAIENVAKQNRMTLTQLREALSREEIPFDTYRKNIKEQLEISQLQQRDILSGIHISEQEVLQFLQSPNGLGGMMHEYKISHILIPLSDAPSPEEIATVTQKAQNVIQKLRNGEDFAQVAIAESTGEHALKGGDLGWRKLPELPTLFERTVATLNINDVPEPIRSSNGLHIIKLMDKRNAMPTQAAVEKTLVRHILIKTNAVTSDEDARQRLSEMRRKIEKGEDFAKLAKAHSADLGSASNGGSLGWITPDVLVPEFSSKMQSLSANEISEPFQSPFGWHLVQVLDRKATQENDETALRQKAKEMIQQRRFEEKLQAWTRQIQDESYVKRYYES